jgi:serine/threonine protein kinase
MKRVVQHTPAQLLKLARDAALLVNLIKQVQAEAMAQSASPYKHLFALSNIAYLARTLVRILYCGDGKKEHARHHQDIPGLYVARHSAGADFFINLKGTPCLRQGTFSKVRKAVWISMAQNKSALIDKKICLSNQDEGIAASFTREWGILSRLRDKQGVIYLIAGISHGAGKLISLFPRYSYTLHDYFNAKSILSISPMTPAEKLCAIKQWLEGLVEIAKHGIHGDLHNANLLIKKEASGTIKAVISNFGNFRFYGRKEYGLTTMHIASPEYLVNKTVTAKLDVWSLGLAMYGLFAKKELPHWHDSLQQLQKRAASLDSEWLSTYPLREETPPFLKELIKAMLCPNPQLRPSARQAFEYYLSKYV